ncbi:MAG: hypothetical protein Q7T79_01220 [bacterium]|nr:hypothetical protein [bacterium]
MRMKEIIDQTIESQIINLLKDGSLSTITIIKKIQKLRQDTPKQSVYLAIRKLKRKEIIALSGKMVSLHQVWIIKMKNFFTEIELHSSSSNEANILKLEEKEYITYNFNSLISLDMFWGHAFILFLKNILVGSTVFLYNPHEWFLIARKQNEINLIKEAKKQGIFWMNLIAGDKALDIEIKKYFDGKPAQCYCLGEDLFEKNYYINSFGDFHIEVWLDKRAVEEIEKIYNKYTEINDNVINLLRKIIERKGYRHKMKISKNAIKAKKIKNLFKKYFFIPNSKIQKY